MTQILVFVATYMGFLWEGARFRIVDSEVSTANGGDALMVVESAALRMRLIQDRGQLFLDLEPLMVGKSEWYSIDLVRRLFLGRREESAVLDGSYAEFVRDYLGEIEERFGPKVWDSTREDLRKLKIQRSKEMFGQR